MTSLKALESRDLYTVGWISALPLERAAATAMLDEPHGKPLDFVQPHNDKNSYTWGRIGEHNVVIASLAAGVYGTTSAVTTALPMLPSFPQIRIGLMVGIGAGIAGQDHDIRLGDIVVSQPHGGSGGVIQYDLRKAKSGGVHERRDFLNMPPEVLLKALANLQAHHELEESKVPEFLKEMVRCYPKLAKSKHGYVHQGPENDRFFKSTYEHVQGPDCGNCNPEGEIQREIRDSTEPEIHYGIIASGNTLIKDAVARDKVVDEMNEDCICFEMEAAGLMNNFPCLVIRGISDYADSHKNDRWQRYAAAVAAAFAKEFLGYVQSEDLGKAQKASDILKNS
jgi:nucleoside phosphorylase